MVIEHVAMYVNDLEKATRAICPLTKADIPDIMKEPRTV